MTKKESRKKNSYNNSVKRLTQISLHDFHMGCCVPQFNDGAKVGKSTNYSRN